MSTPFPTAFRCRFLRDAAEAFVRRRKAIRKGTSGKFTWDSGEEGEHEWLSISIVGIHGNPTLALRLGEGHRASLFFRSGRASERGKVLLRIDDMLLVGNGPGIVEAFEETMSHGHWLDRPGGKEAIRETWRDLSLTLAP